ncbi:MAG TPA: TraB/GumN family protein [Allosphingosinicella sp.]|nr:TraB/GumN family protein [Allosphingosinicella sp.]
MAFRFGKNWLRLGLAGLLPLAGCMAEAAPAARAAARPAMWKLADKDTTVYLFGTIHLLPEGRTWRTPAMEAALAGSQELVLEVANVDDMMASAQAMARMGLASGLPPIAERVPESKRAALRAMIAETGYPEAVFDRLETWAAALSLLGVSFKRLGLDPSLGVERQIDKPFRAAGKTVTGLETVEQQLGYFDTLPEAAQRALLLSVVEDSADTRAQFQAMLEAWSKGDLDGIARTFDDETQMSPELKAVLMSKRNAAWADWLARRMEKPGTVFVAVGAGHLAGADSVQAMLKKKGLKAKRVQ